MTVLLVGPSLAVVSAAFEVLITLSKEPKEPMAAQHLEVNGGHVVEYQLERVSDIGYGSVVYKAMIDRNFADADIKVPPSLPPLFQTPPLSLPVL
jgi:hypothetical protein